jgi:mycoredoxin
MSCKGETMPDQEKIVVYGHPACLMVGPVLAMLKQSKVDFEYVNLFDQPEAREMVREINNGYESVPTLVFPDGSTLTEPSGRQLKAKLEGDGYPVPLQAAIIGNAPQLIFIALIAFFILRITGVL